MAEHSSHFEHMIEAPDTVCASSVYQPDLINSSNDTSNDVDHDISSVHGSSHTCGTLDQIEAVGLSFYPNEQDSIEQPQRFDLEESSIIDQKMVAVPPKHPYDKWLRHLRKKHRRRQTISGSLESSFAHGYGLERQPTSNLSTKSRQRGHDRSSSIASTDFVEAVKSASITLASLSLAPRSRKTNLSGRRFRSDRSTRQSYSGPRFSEDNDYLEKWRVNDHAVTYRSVQRRRILEEITSTEESYLGDMKFLASVYGAFLNKIPTVSSHMREAIVGNLNEIVELHEEILGDLHIAIPNSEYSLVDLETAIPVYRDTGHQRGHSLDLVSDSIRQQNFLQKVPGAIAAPNVGAEVAKVFGEKIHRFWTYEEYGARYEVMVKDIASAIKTIPEWQTYQMGLESLADSLVSINSQQNTSKKLLSVGDLLVKPIQRVCRYPLLFAELLKQTPVCDSPDAHLEIEKVLLRLQESTAEMNKATDDPRAKILLEQTWLLQDRLHVPQTIGTFARNSIRALGHVQLCGVLHAVWQTRDGADGQYVIALLYRDFLILATNTKANQEYMIQAKISLAGIRLEAVDNGRGLQCHTVPFSWKLIFECDHQLYEVILSACSEQEQQVWTIHLADRINAEVAKHELKAYSNSPFSSIFMNMKPLGTVFGKPGTIARRISIKRATTIGAKTTLYQVIIKNTAALKSLPTSASATNLNRSHSLFSSGRIPTFAPPRSERVRIESLISDVWTQDVLPYPGMNGRTREHFVRASAQSMMRKLSVASITSNFSKKSSGVGSLKGNSTKVEFLQLVHDASPSIGVPSADMSAPSCRFGRDGGGGCLNVPKDEENLTIRSQPRYSEPDAKVSYDIQTTNGRLPNMAPQQLAVASKVRLKPKTLGGKKSWCREPAKVSSDNALPFRSSSANTAKARSPAEDRKLSIGRENMVLDVTPGKWSTAGERFLSVGLRGLFH